MVLFIYFLGVLLSWFLLYVYERIQYKKVKFYTFTLGDLVLSLALSAASWFAVALLLCTLSNKIVLIKKE